MPPTPSKGKKRRTWMIVYYLVPVPPHPRSYGIMELGGIFPAGL